ncbi:MAG: galactose-binding domain-like protein [Monoraphidium minutum]|nr:MAG: galactose-binding domain-like protein [Monoraphidium minutum]
MPASQGCCSHDHDCEASDCGPAYSLYKHINLDQVRCLNEEADGSCRAVFRPWEQRASAPAAPLRSDPDDSELLLTIPFDGAVKLKALCVIGGGEGRAPNKMRLFINRDDLDFSTVNAMAALQEFDLQEDNAAGAIEYPTQAAKFNGVHTLTLHFQGTFGSDQSEITFIGLKGDFSERNRRAVEAVYELRPVPEDHKVPGMKQGGHFDVA